MKLQVDSLHPAICPKRDSIMGVFIEVLHFLVKAQYCQITDKFGLEKVQGSIAVFLFSFLFLCVINSWALIWEAKKICLHLHFWIYKIIFLFLVDFLMKCSTGNRVLVWFLPSRHLLVQSQQWKQHRCGVFIVDFEQISHIFLVSIVDCEQVNAAWLLHFYSLTLRINTFLKFELKAIKKCSEYCLECVQS